MVLPAVLKDSDKTPHLFLHFIIIILSSYLLTEHAAPGQKSIFLICFNYTSSEISPCLCLTFFFIVEHISRMCGKRANTIEHQANYVAVNYSSVTQVRKLADAYSFLVTQCVLKVCSQGPQTKL